MYQWVSPNSSLMCLSDKKEWLHYHVETTEITDSDKQNPTEFIYKCKDHTLESARFGQFSLTSDHLKKLDCLQQLITDDDQE